MAPLLQLMLLAGPAPAIGSPATDASAQLMDRALAIEGTDANEALRLLGGIPPSDPRAPRADYERARITDTLLRDLPAADQLYRQHLRDFPASPYLQLAKARANYLEANMGDAPHALAEFEAVTEAWGRHGAADLVPRMERVALDYPTAPIHTRALFWLSNQRQASHDPDGAIHWLELLVAGHPAPKDVHRAELQIALVEQRAGRYAHALEIDERYLDSDDPLARELARNQKESALNARLYGRLYAGGFALLGLLAAGLTFGVWRRRAPIRPWPWELKLYLPIASLFVVLTFLKDPKVGGAVLGIVGGGGLLAALNGAYLRVAYPRGLWRILYLGAMGGAAASLAFCAVHGARLTDLVVTTLAQGADR